MQLTLNFNRNTYFTLSDSSTLHPSPSHHPLKPMFARILAVWNLHPPNASTPQKIKCKKKTHRPWEWFFYARELLRKFPNQIHQNQSGNFETNLSKPVWELGENFETNWIRFRLNGIVTRYVTPPTLREGFISTKSIDMSISKTRIWEIRMNLVFKTFHC